MTVQTPRILLGTLAEHTGPGFWILDSGIKIKIRPSPERLGFWNLNSGPTDSNPSKSRAEFGWGQNSAPRREQNSGGLRSCEGEDLSSAHLGSRDDPNETEPPPTPPDSLDCVWIVDFGFWILDFGFWILYGLVWILDSGFWILDFGFWILFLHLLAMHASSTYLVGSRINLRLRILDFGFLDS